MPDFVAWAFPIAATGAVAREMDVRLAEESNVKDFGATGLGVVDETNAVNAAIVHRQQNGGGVVKFPPGSYRCGNLSVGHNSPSTTIPIILRGSGLTNTNLIGINSSGYMISKNGLAVDDIQAVESLTFVGSGTGGVQLTGTRVKMADCYGRGGLHGVDCSQADGAHLDGVWLNSGSIMTAAQVGAVSPGNTNPFPPGSIGIALGKNTTCIDCRVTNYTYAFAMSKIGPVISGCSSERSFVCIRMGWGPSGEDPCIGGVIQAFQTERCARAIEIYNADSCFIMSIDITGSNGPSDELPVAGMIWSAANGGTVTVNTGSAHNLGAPGTQRLIEILPTAINPTTWKSRGDGVAVATVTDATHFTYLGVTSQPSAFVSGQWGVPSEYGMRLRKVKNSFISSIIFGHTTAIASVDMNFGGEAIHSNNVMQGVDPYNPTGNPYGWIVPTNNKNHAGWKYNWVGGSGNTLAGYGNAGLPTGFMLFSSLPGQPGMAPDFQPGPFEGQEFDIVDAQQQLTFGNQVVGGGSTNHYRVRWATNQWIRIG